MTSALGKDFLEIERKFVVTDDKKFDDLAYKHATKPPESVKQCYPPKKDYNFYIQTIKSSKGTRVKLGIVRKDDIKSWEEKEKFDAYLEDDQAEDIMKHFGIKPKAIGTNIHEYSIDGNTVRVRISENLITHDKSAELCLKSDKQSVGKAIRRKEWEASIEPVNKKDLEKSQAFYDNMVSSYHGEYCIEKTRHTLRWGEEPWTVDVFAPPEKYHHLKLAEIEFTSPQDAEQFNDLPRFLSPKSEVTHNDFFTSRYLSHCKSKDLRKKMLKVFTECDQTSSPLRPPKFYEPERTYLGR